MNFLVVGCDALLRRAAGHARARVRGRGVRRARPLLLQVGLELRMRGGAVRRVRQRRRHLGLGHLGPHRAAQLPEHARQPGHVGPQVDGVHVARAGAGARVLPRGALALRTLPALLHVRAAAVPAPAAASPRVLQRSPVRPMTSVPPAVVAPMRSPMRAVSPHAGVRGRGGELPHGLAQVQLRHLRRESVTKRRYYQIQDYDGAGVEKIL